MLLRTLAKEGRLVGIGSAHPQPPLGVEAGEHDLTCLITTSGLVAEDLRNATTIHFSATCRGGQQRNACCL